jgi:hypothetical protein
VSYYCALLRQAKVTPEVLVEVRKAIESATTSWITKFIEDGGVTYIIELMTQP